jgi:hypothetical protein
MGLFDGFASGGAEDAGVSQSEYEAAGVGYPENINGGYPPSRVSSGANDWADVLKYGLSRAIDAKYAQAVRPQNTVPRYVNGTGAGLGVAGSGGSMLPWLLVAGVVVAVVVAK